MMGDPETAMRFSDRLADEGVFAQPVVFPTVALEKARIRTIVTAAHTDDHLDRALGRLRHRRPGAGVDHRWDATRCRRPSTPINWAGRLGFLAGRLHVNHVLESSSGKRGLEHLAASVEICPRAANDGPADTFGHGHRLPWLHQVDAMDHDGALVEGELDCRRPILHDLSVGGPLVGDDTEAFDATGRFPCFVDKRVHE